MDMFFAYLISLAFNHSCRSKVRTGVAILSSLAWLIVKVRVENIQDISHGLTSIIGSMLTTDLPGKSPAVTFDM